MAKKTADTEKKGTKFPMSLEDFAKKAKPLAGQVAGKDIIMDVRAGDNPFSSGGVGFFMSDKIILDIGGTPVKFQATFSLSAIGSKELAKLASK